MKNTTFVILLILTLLLAACGSRSAAPTVASTEAPPTAETETEQVQTTAEAVATGMGNLTGTTWAWIGFMDPTQQFSVDNPTNFTLTFQANGTVNIKADCNNAIGSYSGDGESLTIEVGPMTKAMCPSESRSDDFVKYLGLATLYFFEDGNLYIDLMADGGTMAFASAETLMADDGEGAIVRALWANSWQWVSFTNPVEQYQIANPENYVLTFNEDGTVNIKADCNNAAGRYIADDSSLTIEVGPSTMALCPSESRSEDFIKYLGAATIYFFEEGDMFIDLMADGGTLRLGQLETSANIKNTPMTPVPEQGNPERVSFQPGTTSDSRSGIIDQGMPKSYVLRALSGQTIIVETVSHGEPLAISIGNTRGDLLPITGVNSQINNSVSVILPETTDFIVTIRPLTPPENPQLGFDITFIIN